MPRKKKEEKEPLLKRLGISFGMSEVMDEYIMFNTKHDLTNVETIKDSNSNTVRYKF